MSMEISTKKAIILLLISISPFSFSLAQVQEIDEVKIISNRAQNENGIKKGYVINQYEIQNAPIQSIEDLLEYAVNIDLRQRGIDGIQSDVSIRGGSFEQVLILLNGIKINDPQTGHHSMNIPVSIQQIEKIEILTGGGTRLYGNYAYTGAINIITKKESSKSLLLASGENNFKSIELNGSFKSNNINHSISVLNKSSDGYFKGMDYKTNNLFYQASLEKNNFSSLLNIALIDKKFGAYSFYTPKYPDQYEEIQTEIYSLQFSYKLDDFITISNKIFKRSNQDEFILFRENPDWYHNFHKTKLYGFDFNITKKTNTGSNVIGAEMIYDNIISNRLGDSLLNQIAINENNFYTLGANRTITNFFVEKNITHNKLSISAGLMMNVSNDNESEIFPGIDLSYLLSDKFTISGSFSKSMRRPNYTELYYSSPTNQGNKNLKSEFSKNSELSISYLDKNHRTSITFYKRNGENMIDWILLDGDSIWRTQNLTNISFGGFELSSLIKLSEEFNNKLKLNSVKINYAYNYADSSSSGFQSAYVLDFLSSNFSMSLNQKFKSINVSWKLTRQDRKGSYINFSSNNEIEYEPFTLISTRITKQIFDNNILFVEIYNLLNKDYVDFGNVPQPGRIFRGGLRINF